MVRDILLAGLVAFTSAMIAAYAGALHALGVYYDPEIESIFLADETEQR